MTNYDPEAHLHEYGVQVIRVTFPSEHAALYIPRLNRVYLQPGLHPHKERGVLAHEVPHVESGTKHTNGNIERHRIIENRCDWIAARRLVSIEELAEQLSQTTDLGECAYNLRVTGRMIRVRLLHLTIEEQLELRKQYAT